MNKIASFIRVSILLILSMSAFILLLGEEQSQANFFIDKVLGIAAIYLITRLYKRWIKIDPWLIAYEKMCNEVEKKPNSMSNNSED